MSLLPRKSRLEQLVATLAGSDNDYELVYSVGSLITLLFLPTGCSVAQVTRARVIKQLTEVCMMIDTRTPEEKQASLQRGKAKAAELRKQLAGKGSSKVSKDCGNRQSLVNDLTAQNTVTSRRKLREMRDVYYSTDEFHPSAGAAWRPDGHNMARGSVGRSKKLLSGYNAKQKQGLNIGKK